VGSNPTLSALFFMEEIKYPVRINKYLAYKKVSARREADEFILQKRVKINGRIAVLGDKVKKNDKVEVISQATGFKKKLIYLAFNKPKGVIAHSPQMGEKEIKDIINLKGVFPVGRLDKNSSGLIILTNDGRITDRLLNPKHEHQKEYFVKVNKNVDGLFLKKMSQGVKLEDGYFTKKCVARKIGKDRFSIILTEGKKHQIRRMCAVLGYSILHLERKRIMNIKLGNLQQGDFREIKGKELQDFLASLELSVSEAGLK
jgi:23S rRNA pseudouridine2604 synthase